MKPTLFISDLHLSAARPAMVGAFKRFCAGQAREAAEGVWQERLALDVQQQALKYERRIQELEMQWTGAAGGCALLRGVLPGDPSRGSVLD